jgi:opacity protein-like surface antigen
MRTISFAAMLIAALLVSSAASAQEPRASVQAFGGLGVSNFTSVNTNFGGVITGDLTENIQVIGEAARLSNVLPSMSQLLFGVSPVGLTTSAFYAEGGVRLSGGSSSVRPYAQASAGIARLTPHVSGIPAGLPGTLGNLGLSFLDRNAPIATIGAGVTLNAGHFVADLGYRYHQVFSDSWIDALALGSRMNTSEARLGIGVRF